jgi:hypothetical protein
MPTESIQSMGGKARAEALSKEELSESARRAAEARWALPKATHEGRPLKIGDIEIPCAVLEGEIRVLSERAVTKALGGKRGGSHWLRMREEEAGAILPVYLSANNLRPFIDNDLALALKPTIYRALKGGKAYGLRAELLPKICNVLLRARDADALHWRQRPLAVQADILIRGLAEVGIIALVDEATGYQRDRNQEALARILDAFVAKELRAWAKTFPEEFYEHIFRLHGWPYNPAKVKRPQVIGHYTNDLYARLAPGVLDELRRKNPLIEGRRKHKLFQWLTGEFGDPRLRSLLDGAIALMRISEDWPQFRQFLKRAYPKYEKMPLGFNVKIEERK